MWWRAYLAWLFLFCGYVVWCFWRDGKRAKEEIAACRPKDEE